MAINQVSLSPNEHALLITLPKMNAEQKATHTDCAMCCICLVLLSQTGDSDQDTCVQHHDLAACQ